MKRSTDNLIVEHHYSVHVGCSNSCS